MMNVKTYSELITFPTFEERYKYLRLGGKVGEDTFGFDRYLNQSFYKSDEWLSVRNKVITRDLGCDLGCVDREIPEGVTIFIHHMNPITKNDILDQTELLLNPEYLITTIKRTHDAIHYGDDNFIFTGLVERSKNDTCLWK
nr:MAG TPA: HNH endonuclease bacteriophage, HNH Endonuclease, DNA.52A [Caudoviricetes sp.]